MSAWLFDHPLAALLVLWAPASLLSGVALCLFWRISREDER